MREKTVQALREELAEVEAEAASIRQLIGEQPGGQATRGATVGKRKSTMSAAGRKKIALAAKKRWAKYRAAQKKTAK